MRGQYKQDIEDLRVRSLTPDPMVSADVVLYVGVWNTPTYYHMKLEFLDQKLTE